MPGNLPFPTVKEFLGCLNEGWDTESHTQSELEKAGFDNVQVTTVSQKMTVSVADVVQLVVGILPVVLSNFWTPKQREEHEKDVPVVLKQYLEEQYGPDGVVPLEPRVVIATGQKPS